MLVCQNLVRRFGERTAVNDVSFSVSAGETYGLLGPNGAGKTTTISMVAGILTPDSGQVTVAGEPIDARAGDAKRAIGLVPQDIALYDDLTGQENLRFFGRLQGLGGKALAGRIAAVLELVGLDERGGERIDAYSGGMKRRANIAVGLLHEPQLLILDEPTVGVDPQSRNQILESIQQLGESGLAVLYTTHYMEEAERLCDRIGIIDEGILVAEGTQSELVERVGDDDRIVLEAEGELDRYLAQLERLPGVVSAVRSDTVIEVRAQDATQLLPEVLGSATSVGVAVRGVELREPDLEAVFLQLTGKALRD